MPALKRLYSYGRTFGVIYGCRNFLQRTKTRGLLSMRVKSGCPLIFLRAQSSDLEAFDEVFVRQAYMTEKLSKERASVIIDAGSNIGLTSLFFAQRYPDAQIIAIEPELSNFELLKQNTANYSKITPLRAALWSANEDLQVVDPGGGFWSFRVKEAGDRSAIGPVQGITVGRLRERFGLGTIDIFKIDIEGAEKEIFEADPAPWLSATKVLIIELHDRFNEGSTRMFYSALVYRPFVQEIFEKNVFVYL